MKTIKKQCVIEFEEKKSKFIGYIKPVQSKEEAERFIEEIKKKHTDATHNCSVYKIFSNGIEYFKTDDDGEPSGTAGKPMGEIVNILDVNNLVVIATRYFGGIKLGAGGLVRNYAKTAKLAIQESEIIEYICTKDYLLDLDYDKVQELEYFFKKYSIEIQDKNYGERVTYKVVLSEEQLEKVEEISGVLVVEL